MKCLKTRKHFNADELELVCQQLFDPYEFMYTIDNFEYPTLPPKAIFYARLILSGTSDINYKHALHAYTKFKCSKFLDYHMLY